MGKPPSGTPQHYGEGGISATIYCAPGLTKPCNFNQSCHKWLLSNRFRRFARLSNFKAACQENPKKRAGNSRSERAPRRTVPALLFAKANGPCRPERPAAPKTPRIAALILCLHCGPRRAGGSSCSASCIQSGRGHKHQGRRFCYPSPSCFGCDFSGSAHHALLATSPERA